MIEGYKETSLGLIPKSWEVNHLGKICDVRDGTHDSPKYHNTGIPFITSKNLTETELCFENIKFISKEDHINFSKRSHVENGDILFGMIGTVGKPIIVNEDFEFSIKNVALLKFSKSKKLNNYYALNVLKSSIVDNQFKKMSNGGVLKFVALGNIRNLIFTIPPLPEQQKIAEILSTVDDKIEVIDQQITETQALKKGLMQRLLTKGIGHTEFKDSPLGMIPESWEVVSVKEITKEHKQGFYTKDGYVDNGTRLARITDLNNPKIDFSGMPMLNISVSDYQSYKIEKGDFLFARSGAIGRYGIVENEEYPAVFASYLIRFRFNSNIVNRFFGYFFESYLCENQLRGITQGNANVNINAENIKSLKFPLAPIEEQNKIASIISSVDDKLEVLSEKKTHYQELKQGLMQQLLTGKIRVKI